jgi:hypothetical protein
LIIKLQFVVPHQAVWWIHVKKKNYGGYPLACPLKKNAVPEHECTISSSITYAGVLSVARFCSRKKKNIACSSIVVMFMLCSAVTFCAEVASDNLPYSAFFSL